MAAHYSTFDAILLTTLRILLCLYTFSIPSATARSSTQWFNHGKDLFNTRHAKHEPLINTSSVAHMSMKWRFITGFDVSATPAIFRGMLYFPSWNGNLHAISAQSGKLVWMRNLTELTGILYGDHQRGENTTLSRSTPTIAGWHKEMLIVGLYGPAVVIAVTRSNGDLIWQKQIDFAPASVITMSGTYYHGGFYVGTSSVEENFPEECCTFQGCFMRLDVTTGQVVWRTPMLPNNHGQQNLYSGAPMWGSSPSIDPIRSLVFIATGNVYSVPPEVEACQEEQNNKTVKDIPNPCIEPDNHEESILALDLGTGEIKWYHQLGGYDAWVSSCSGTVRSPNCPTGPNPDHDFSDCPSLLTIDYGNGTKKDVAVAAQKGGTIWAVERDTGALVWSSVTGPEGGGGQIWGTATDGKAIYVNVPNSRHKNWTLVPETSNITIGGWAAIEASTGTVLWSAPNPTLSPPIGPVSLANSEVVFGTSMDRNGSVFALDAHSGAVLWSATTNANIYGGVSISNGCIFVGCGASTNVGAGYNGTRGDSVYAFCILY
ncbi:hypothetical protein L7F22_035949 [Adiantum nelumboides]|nr:hypothetical protein [Adiantum nelumboides]